MLDASKHGNFDFDYWAELARTDPDAFDAARRQAIDRILDSAPESARARLEKVQWKIDHVRRRSGTPLAACLKISDLMWDRVLGQGGLLSAIEHLGDPNLPFGRAESAEVVPFPERERLS